MQTTGNASNSLSGIAMVAALFVVAVWVGMLLWLMAHTDATEVIWARWLTVTASLEAIAFAAAGAIFGTTVQGQRVKEAKERAAESNARAAIASSEAKANLKDAVNGKTLATAIKKRRRKSRSSSNEGFQSAPTADADEDDDLLALADRMFPD